MIIAVDFDGTLTEHIFPEVGKDLPESFEWLKRFQKHGADLVLWTCRGWDQERGDTLGPAVQRCSLHGVEFAAINSGYNNFTNSPKAYADIYIDDKAFGCPLTTDSKGDPCVDWSVVGPAVMKQLPKTEFEAHLKRAKDTVSTWPKWKQNVLTESMKAFNDQPRRPT